MTDDDLLLHALAYAIGLTALRPRDRVAEENDKAKLAAARVIAEHLKLSGWQITKGSPAPAHSTHDNRRDGD